MATPAHTEIKLVKCFLFLLQIVMLQLILNQIGPLLALQVAFVSH